MNALDDAFSAKFQTELATVSDRCPTLLLDIWTLDSTGYNETRPSGAWHFDSSRELPHGWQRSTGRSIEQPRGATHTSRRSRLSPVVSKLQVEQTTRSVHPGDTVSVRARPHRAQCCARTSRGFQSTGCATARVMNWLQEFGLQLPNSFGLPHTHCERVRTRTRLDSSSPTANPTTLAARTTWLTLATRYTLSPAKWI